MGQTTTDILDIDATYHRPGAARLAAAIGETLVDDKPTPDLDGLRLVVEAVRSVRPDQFDMGWWSMGEDSCRTMCCAIGWFCKRNPTDALAVNGLPRWCARGEDPFDDHPQIARRFRISLDDSLNLFSLESYYESEGERAQAAVIARLEQFIRDHTPAAAPRQPDPDDYDRAFGDHDSNGTA